MTKENKVLMQEARETLRGKWGLAVGAYFLYMLITVIAGSPAKIGSVIQLLISGPLLLGLSAFFLSLSRKEEVSVSFIFIGFQDFVRSFIAYLLMALFIGLWSLLFIMPGIIAALAYSQTFVILREDRSVSAGQAIKRSKALMQGNKKKLFFLGLRFFGWFLLSILTLGIGLLWLMPYLHTALAGFYDDISRKLNLSSVSQPIS